jgi:hypothetical protein
LVPHAPGYDLSFMDRAANELLNDYELVKGQGRVPVNRQYEPVVEQVEEGPWEFSPTSAARQDLRGQVVRLLSRTENLEGETVSKSLELEWQGASGQMIRIVDMDKQLYAIPFISLSAIGYKTQPQYFLFTYSGQKNQSEELLIEVTMPLIAWAQLKRCCYVLCDGTRHKSCDMPDTGDGKFWEKKIQKLLVALKFHKISIPPTISRSSSEQSTSSLDKGQATLIGNTDPSNISNSANELLRKRPRPRTSPSQHSGSESDGFAPMRKKVKTGAAEIDRAIIASKSECLEPGKSSKGLFYSPVDSQDRQPVEIGDMVVRLRVPKNLASKRDSNDIFDGPWDVIRFNMFDHAYANSVPRDDDEFKKMLKTKVKLKFPRKSRVADRWVEIGRLLPVMDLKNTCLESLRGTIEASGPTIAECPAFRELHRQKESIERGSGNNGASIDLSGAPFNSEIEHADTNHPSQLEDDLHDQQKTNSDFESIGLVRIKKNLLIAIIDISSEGVGDIAYEIEKLRGKRLRRFIEHDMETDMEDPWVKRYQRVSVPEPQFARSLTDATMTRSLQRNSVGLGLY